MSEPCHVKSCIVGNRCSHVNLDQTPQRSGLHCLLFHCYLTFDQISAMCTFFKLILSFNKNSEDPD